MQAGFVVPCKVIQITLVFQIPTLSIPDSNLEYSGFQPLVFRIPVSRILQIPFKNREWIPDSDTGLDSEKNSRISDYVSWDEIWAG